MSEAEYTTASYVETMQHAYTEITQVIPHLDYIIIVKIIKVWVVGKFFPDPNTPVGAEQLQIDIAYIIIYIFINSRKTINHILQSVNAEDLKFFQDKPIQFTHQS